MLLSPCGNRIISDIPDDIGDMTIKEAFAAVVAGDLERVQRAVRRLGGDVERTLHSDTQKGETLLMEAAFKVELTIIRSTIIYLYFRIDLTW
jgi:hypothetical protein